MMSTNYRSNAILTLVLFVLVKQFSKTHSFHQHAAIAFRRPLQTRTKQTVLASNQRTESTYSEDSSIWTNKVFQYDLLKTKQQTNEVVYHYDNNNVYRMLFTPESVVFGNKFLYPEESSISSTVRASSTTTTSSDEEVGTEEKTMTTTIDDSNDTTSTTTTTTRKLPPVLQQIADERMEYRMNLGRAMDALRKDMSDILVRKPDFTIYHEEIEVMDPSGIQLKGLKNYKSAIAFFQTFVQFWFETTPGGVQYRMVYDFARSTIRISWNMKLVPKFAILRSLNRPLYVDGISHYTVCARNGGKITEHKIENLLINNTPIVPPYGIWNILQQQPDYLQPGRMGGGKYSPKGVPGGICASTTTTTTTTSMIASTTATTSSTAPRTATPRLGLFGI